jgi:hypothetical protein
MPQPEVFKRSRRRLALGWAEAETRDAVSNLANLGADTGRDSDLADRRLRESYEANVPSCRAEERDEQDRRRTRRVKWQ